MDLTQTRIDNLLRFTCINSLGNLEEMIKAAKALGIQPKRIIIPKIEVMGLKVEFGDVTEVTLK